MIMNSVSQSDNGEGDIAEGFENAFGGRAVCSLVLRSRIEPHNFLFSLSQFTTNAKFEQDDKAQGEKKQPSQATDTLLVVQENRANVQVTAFETRNAYWGMVFRPSFC